MITQIFRGLHRFLGDYTDFWMITQIIYSIGVIYLIGVIIFIIGVILFIQIYLMHPDTHLPKHVRYLY